MAIPRDTLYWCVYPAGSNPKPSAPEIVYATYPTGIFGNDVAPQSTQYDVNGSPVIGMVPGQSYELAAVAFNGISYTNVEYSASFTAPPTNYDQLVDITGKIVALESILNIRAISPDGYTLYWCIFPATAPLPTAEQMYRQTYPGGVFGTDVCPISTFLEFAGTPISPLQQNTSYRIGVVAHNNVDTSLPAYSDAYTTLWDLAVNFNGVLPEIVGSFEAYIEGTPDDYAEFTGILPVIEGSLSVSNEEPVQPPSLGTVEQLVWGNFASSTLAVAVGPTDFTIQITMGDGALFPDLGTNEYAIAVLDDWQDNQEVVYVTGKSGDVFTVVRAQENTVEQIFPTGSKFELRPTAGFAREFIDGGYF